MLTQIYKIQCLVLWCQSLFAPSRMNAAEKVWKLKLIKKTDTSRLRYAGDISGYSLANYLQRDSIRWASAVVVLLLLKLIRPLTNAIFVFIVFSHESLFSLLTSMYGPKLTLPFFTFSCFFVTLFVSSFFALNIKRKSWFVQYLELFASQIYRYIGFITGNSLSLAY